MVHITLVSMFIDSPLTFYFPKGGVKGPVKSAASATPGNPLLFSKDVPNNNTKHFNIAPLYSCLTAL